MLPVPDAVLDNGVDKALRIIDKVAQCIETDQWPGIAGGDSMPLVVPWYEMEEDLTGFEDGP